MAELVRLSLSEQLARVVLHRRATCAGGVLGRLDVLEDVAGNVVGPAFDRAVGIDAVEPGLHREWALERRIPGAARVRERRRGGRALLDGDHLEIAESIVVCIRRERVGRGRRAVADACSHGRL